jgi:RNA polymerase sigma factor (sigma-70 family)
VAACDRPLQGAVGPPRARRGAIGRADRVDHRRSGRQSAALQEKNRSEVLRDSLANLSPEQGEVIDLVYYHGKSVKEVAEIVGVGEATVKTRMFYARRKLASLVAAA